ncbi:nucleoid-associated protein [Chitinivorax sp. B]|uniref:nucleoid-associated protein n=1 Tax=Chitinivorax sp. B TaxID=2502235 RepID=UPI0010F46957|nr:nucleoid-associated protein [Chitinivorax sp. B]
MINIQSATVENIIIHQVGNKSREEGYRFSSVEATDDGGVKELLVHHYLASVVKGGGDGFVFFHESDVELNEIFHFCKEIFTDPTRFCDASESIAKHLYAHSLHPNVSAGDLLVVRFNGVQQDGEPCQAIGIFKSEIREPYLSVEEVDGGFSLHSDRGISLGMVQKGALILDDSYTVFAVDKLSNKTKYWLESFLKVKKKPTEKACLKSLTQLVKQVTNEIEEPTRAIEYNRALTDQVSNDGALTIEDIKQISSEFIAPEMVAEVIAKTEARDQITLPDTIDVPAEKLTEAVRKGSRKIRVMAGLELVFQDKYQIASIDKDEDTESDSITVTLKLGRRHS